MFEKVNKAYEFLCTKSARIVDGPDPENIILILQAQSILFKRYKQGERYVGAQGANSANGARGPNGANMATANEAKLAHADIGGNKANVAYRKCVEIFNMRIYNVTQM